jgi:TonB family protein
MSLDGELSAAESAEVMAHLAVCDDCRKRMDVLHRASREISAAHQRLDALLSVQAQTQHSAESWVTSGGELRPEAADGTATFGSPIRLARSYISGYNKRNTLMSSPGLQPVPNSGPSAAGSAASVPPSNVLPTLLGEGYGIYGVRRGSFVASYALTTLMVVAVVLSGRFVVQHKEVIQNKLSGIVTDISPYILQPSKTRAGGGGGGGDHDKIEASKGALPKFAQDQFTPPVRVIRNPNPVLPVTPSVVVPPQIKIASTMPVFGDPYSHNVNGPDSNGVGTGGGIGSGSGGGVGSGSGPGVGPGYGGGIGGGVYSVGGGVSAPKVIYDPQPDYSDEARKAKFQGVVVLWCVVGADGRVRDVRVQRSLGMGLDEKAIEAVRTWKFEPARKDGVAVPVQVAVEINFHLY